MKTTFEFSAQENYSIVHDWNNNFDTFTIKVSDHKPEDDAYFLSYLKEGSILYDFQAYGGSKEVFGYIEAENEEQAKLQIKEFLKEF
jgi:hypothetical protein